MGSLPLRLETEKEQAVQAAEIEQARLEQVKIEADAVQKRAEDARNQQIYDRYRKECIEISESNSAGFSELVESCLTQLCVDTVLTNKDIQNFGAGFVSSCLENKLSGKWGY